MNLRELFALFLFLSLTLLDFLFSSSILNFSENFDKKPPILVKLLNLLPFPSSRILLQDFLGLD